MAKIPVQLPPGVFRNGTEYQSKGRYYDANLVRWYGTALGPIGGFRQRSTTLLTGAARAALTWKDNSSITWLAVGTHSKLFVTNRAGTVFDITPASFTAGRATAVAGGGYGSGTFGTGTYGTPRPDSSLIQDATQWSLDRWGQHLVGVSPDDGFIYEWSLNTSTIAPKVTNAPTCTALVVTEEGFLFALATTDPRTVSWCDQQANTVWTPSTTNQAGNYPLQTAGRLMCGKQVQGGTLLYTDLDVWLATYIGGTLVYSIKKKGDACGAISRQASCSFEMKAFWMSPDCHFWQYNGYVQPVACDVRDYIIKDINLLQASKIFTVHNAANFEIEINYCSSGSSEIDRCVIWNYQGDAQGVPYWNIGRPARTCGVDKGAFAYPVRVDSVGTIYDHEVGAALGGVAPYATGGPIELGHGDNTYDIMGLYPDDATVGDVTATFYARNYTDDTKTAYGPYALTSKTDLRIPGRQIEARFDGVRATSWRVGAPVLDISQSGQR